MTEQPDHATHYYRADRKPFQNLSELDGPELQAVMAELATAESRALSHRRFGPKYLGLRRATEAGARELFIAAGGEPERDSPHYLVLGDSPWFEGLYVHPRKVQLPLSALPPLATSFTCTDSVTALGLGVELGIPQPPLPHCRKLYPLSELGTVLSEHGPPEPHRPSGYDGHQRALLNFYVEIQLWSDGPLRALAGQL